MCWKPFSEIKCHLIVDDIEVQYADGIDVFLLPPGPISPVVAGGLTVKIMRQLKVIVSIQENGMASQILLILGNV